MSTLLYKMRYYKSFADSPGEEVEIEFEEAVSRLEGAGYYAPGTVAEMKPGEALRTPFAYFRAEATLPVALFTRKPRESRRCIHCSILIEAGQQLYQDVEGYWWCDECWENVEVVE